MKKIILYTVGSIVLGLCVFAIGAYAIFWYSVVYGMYITQPLAQDVRVTSEWQRVEIQPPLKIKKQVQSISLRINGFESKTSDDYQKIILSNGTILNPEVILIDENNKTYLFKDSSRSYNRGKTQEAQFAIDRKLNGIDSLPKDVKYTAIMIRSDKFFKCDLIWIDNDLK